MNYRVKDKIVDALEKQGDYRLVEQSTSMLLRRTRINRYEKIPCNNGRLQTLFNEAFSRERNGAELLLWIPASRPYYSTKSVFDKNKGYSKTLVFSSWEMVPRMIAGLTSYEAERLTVAGSETEKMPNKCDILPRTVLKGSENGAKWLCDSAMRWRRFLLTHVEPWQSSMSRWNC